MWRRLSGPQIDEAVKAYKMQRDSRKRRRPAETTDQACRASFTLKSNARKIGFRDNSR